MGLLIATTSFLSLSLETHGDATRSHLPPPIIISGAEVFARARRRRRRGQRLDDELCLLLMLPCEFDIIIIIS